MRLSVLDISPVPSGSTGGDALRNSTDLAQHAERLGYLRYWFAEHHGGLGVASSSPEIMIAHVAQATSSIRVGSGGVMLPNHSPLKVAEWFRVLEALHPGRIDLGIGRAPGTDAMTALALRRSQAALQGDDFPDRLAELLAYFGAGFPDDHPFSRVRAVPADAGSPPVWLLGSSDFSAQLAADWGLRFAFAHHINPHAGVAAVRLYREAAPDGEPPILAVSAICADTEAEAEELAASVRVAWLPTGRGRRGPLPSVAEVRAMDLTPEERSMADSDARHLTGSADRVATRIAELAAEAGTDEVMVLTIVHDHAVRRRSYELLAGAFGLAAAE